MLLVEEIFATNFVNSDTSTYLTISSAAYQKS